MLKFNILIYLIMGLFLAFSVNAATIYGTVYDLSLKKVNNARVEIDTSPKQLIVAQNGSYSFNVPNGAYTIKAQLVQKNTVTASVQENITINQDGSYVLDLILFPDIEEGVEDIDIDVNGDIVETENKNNILIGFVILFILVVIITVYYINKIHKNQRFLGHQKSKGFFSEQKKETIETKKIEEKIKEEDDLEQITKIIKEEGGRATQKDIRKKIPLSEAKISLMIAELEHKGIIEKIKKGRGNIIILKKK